MDGGSYGRRKDRCRAPQGARGLKSVGLRDWIARELQSRPARGAWVEIELLINQLKQEGGRAPQGARGLKLDLKGRIIQTKPSRAPQGARGLKFAPSCGCGSCGRSRPARGAWVEIKKGGYPMHAQLRRAPQGARGLKCHRRADPARLCHRRAPQGARGLKYKIRLSMVNEPQVAPRKGRVG